VPDNCKSRIQNKIIRKGNGPFLKLVVVFLRKFKPAKGYNVQIRRDRFLADLSQFFNKLLPDLRVV